MLVRKIRKEDNEELAALIRQVFREYGVARPGTVYTDPATDHLYELFRTNGSSYFVAEDNGSIAGGCGIFPTTGLDEGCAELVKLYIRKEFRGKGTGSALFKKSIEAARELGYTKLYLESFAEFSEAVSLYKKHGFLPLSHPLGNSGHYACTIWMLKDL